MHILNASIRPPARKPAAAQVSTQQDGALALARSIVPGEYPQVQQDLLRFGEPVLRLLNEYGMRVAVLADGQTLRDSPALRFPTDKEYHRQRSDANAITQKALTEARGVTAEQFAESTTRLLRKAGLEFHFGISSRNLTADDIAQRQNIPPEQTEHWKACFAELNEGLPAGLYLLPHPYYEGKPISENLLRNSKEITAEFVERSLGLNRPEDRLVLLHQKFTPAKAEEVGNYRLVLHEMGHALDHVLEATTGLPGFGALHRATVDRLYQADLKKAENSSPDKVFTSDRADDDEREYFAEAVEAYLTYPKGDDGEFFRAGNSNPGLKAKNPELYAYLDKVFHTDLSTVAAPELPAQPLLPEGVPDPDTAVYYL